MQKYTKFEATSRESFDRPSTASSEFRFSGVETSGRSLTTSPRVTEKAGIRSESLCRSMLWLLL